MKHCIEFCPECMAGPGNGVKSEQGATVTTEDGRMVIMGGGKKDGVLVDGSTGLPLVETEGGMVFPGGTKEGGVFVDGELGMPIMGGGKKTGGQFVVGGQVHDKDGYLVGKDGSLVS